MLDCRVEGGAGFIIGSTKDVTCTYTPADKAFGARKLSRRDPQDRPRHRRDRRDVDQMGRARPRATTSMRPARWRATMSARAPRLGRGRCRRQPAGRRLEQDIHAAAAERPGADRRQSGGRHGRFPSASAPPADRTRALTSEFVESDLRWDRISLVSRHATRDPRPVAARRIDGPLVGERHLRRRWRCACTRRKGTHTRKATSSAFP